MGYVSFREGTLPETNIAMENPQFWWYLPGKIVIFMGYVSFREGNLFRKQLELQLTNPNAFIAFGPIWRNVLFFPMP